MKPSHSRPPVLATRLLERLVPGPHREALSGDLIEQYREGRSGFWYWRQVLAAVAAGVAKDVRDHKLLSARAAIIGLAVYLLSAFPVMWIMPWWERVLSERLLVPIVCGLTGWIVARLHRPHQLAVTCTYAASLLLFESVHVSAGLLMDPGRHPMTLQMLPMSVYLLTERPLSVLIGGLSAVHRAPAPHSVP